MEDLYVIAGLGNPGSKYDGTRHNAGFDVIDVLVDKYRLYDAERFGKCMMAKGRIEGKRVILMKPMTYMNLSGEAVREVVSYFKVDPSDHLIVISDDIELDIGKLRIRKKGSAGGHNGLKDIIRCLGTDAFARIRVGVGKKPHPDFELMDFVLSHFSVEERQVMDEAEEKAAQAVVCFMTEGPDAAMNRFNTPKEKKKKVKKTGAGPQDPSSGEESLSAPEKAEDVAAADASRD
jgi:PTH1 family peptidyl-tRNA hydrolase